MTYATRHATEMAAERFGVAPTEADWRDAFLAITGGGAVLVRRQADGQELWLVQVAGRAMLAVYAPDQATVVTVLPAGARRKRL